MVDAGAGAFLTDHRLIICGIRITHAAGAKKNMQGGQSFMEISGI
jgi:hypothetical protein